MTSIPVVALEDDMVEAGAILAVNYPALSFRPGGRAYSWSQALLSRINNVGFDVANSAPDISLLTAAGLGLDALGANFGIPRFKGSGSAVPVCFYLQSAAQVTQVISVGTLVGTTPTTTGTTASIGFYASAPASIAIGQVMAGPILTSTPVNLYGGTTLAGLMTINASTTQKQYAFASYSFLMNTPTTYSVYSSAPAATSNTTQIMGPGAGGVFSTGVTYDQSYYIPGVAFSVATASSGGYIAYFDTFPTPVLCIQTGPTDPETGWIYGTQGNISAYGIDHVVGSTIPGLQALNMVAVTGTNNTILGLDPWGDPIYLAQLNAQLYPQYGIASAQAAVLSLPSVYACTIVDPQNGSGQFTVYWCDASGNQPGLTYPGGVPTIASNTLASQVDSALRAVLAGAVTPVYAAFTVVNISSVAVSYSANSSVQTATIAAQIETVIAAYIQALQPNQIPTVFGMVNALSAANVLLSNFTLTSTSPSVGAASPTTVYRCTGVSSAVVVPTRV